LVLIQKRTLHGLAEKEETTKSAGKPAEQSVFSFL